MKHCLSISKTWWLMFVVALAMEITTGLVISTAQGRLRGVARDGHVSYLGIPYATISSPASRFKGAGLAPIWHGIRESESRHCSVFSLPEECLHLDVHLPSATGSAWPVLVWVRGGSGQYNPAKLVQQGILVVIVSHRDAYFVSHVSRSVRRHATSYYPVFFYQFSHVGAVGVASEPGVKKTGAAHSDELAYLFTDGSELEGHDALVQENLIRTWTNFVKYLNPTPNGSNPKWEQVDPSAPRLLDIGRELRMETFPHVKEARMWDQICEKFYYNRYRADSA